MTCTINRFEDGTVEPLGAALTRDGNAGALAVWSSTGLSVHGEATQMQQTFMRLASNAPTARIGDLIQQTLSSNSGETAGLYVLLGDPAVALDLPKEVTNGGQTSANLE
jgi:hypothetical protein